ncbi:MAG TPA: hypothetical protein PKA64_11895 [Myxococcota bacterium]|nr:hypothetical protein [Myxococcota bacterium]
MLRLIGLLVVLGGCNDIGDFSYLPGYDEWKQTPTDQVDILWVVDNSNSMQLEQTLLGTGFSTFAQELENTNTNFHIGVITTDFDYDDPARGKLIAGLDCPAVIDLDTECANPENPSEIWDYRNVFVNRARVGTGGSGKEKGLEAARFALSANMTTGPNAGFLRPDANLLVVFVSDEDDCSDAGALEGQEAEACYTQEDKLTPVGEFVQFFEGLKRSPDMVQLSAIVGPEGATSICDETTLEGTRYIDVSRLSGGLSGSICETDWSPMLYDLGLNAVGINYTFQMQHGAVPGTLKVFIDGDPVPESGIDGYTYDPEAKSITFWGTYVPERGATISAEYDIEPGT